MTDVSGGDDFEQTPGAVIFRKLNSFRKLAGMACGPLAIHYAPLLTFLPDI